MADITNNPQEISVRRLIIKIDKARELARYFDVQLKAIADEVFEECKSGKKPFNLSTIQKIIMRKARSGAHLSVMEAGFFDLVRKSPKSLRLFARVVKKGIDDKSLLQDKHGARLLRRDKSFADIFDPFYEKIDSLDEKIYDAKRRMKVKIKTVYMSAGVKIDEFKTRRAQRADAKRAKRARVRAARREGGVIKTMKRAGAAVGKAVRWIFRLPPKVKG